MKKLYTAPTVEVLQLLVAEDILVQSPGWEEDPNDDTGGFGGLT